MSEEQTAIPAEHVSIGDGGQTILSPEAEAALMGIDDTPPVVTVDETPPIETPPGKTIKWNGQEIEVKADQEIELLQKGYNYEQKMSALEAERAKLQSYNGLVSAIEASPEIRQKVSAALGYQQEPAKPEVPQFDDPIEQLKWETRQEVLREVEEKFIKPMQAQTLQTTHVQTLNNIRQQVQTDPQYQEIQTAILAQIKSLPESISKGLYQQLDQDPRAYLDMFQATKARLTNTPNTQTPSSPIPEPVKRETKAPLLESGNNAPSASETQKQNEHIKALEKRSRAGDYRATGELMELMA